MATFSLVSGSIPNKIPFNKRAHTRRGSLSLRARSRGSSSRYESWETSERERQIKGQGIKCFSYDRVFPRPRYGLFYLVNQPTRGNLLATNKILVLSCPGENQQLWDRTQNNASLYHKHEDNHYPKWMHECIKWIHSITIDA